MPGMQSLSTPVRGFFSVGLVLGVLIGWPAMAGSDGGDAGLIHACVNPSNLTRIVDANDACRHNERSVHWPAAFSKAAAPAAGGALTVVDKAGKSVGPLIRPEAVALAVDGERVVVGVRPDRLYGLVGVAFYFRELNCSGERLVSPAADVLLPYVQVVSTTGYFGGREAVPYQVGSMLYAGSSAATPVCYNNTSPFPTYNLTPARIVDLGGFTPPFSVK